MGRECANWRNNRQTRHLVLSNFTNRVVSVAHSCPLRFSFEFSVFVMIVALIGFFLSLFILQNWVDVLSLVFCDEQSILKELEYNRPKKRILNQRDE